jgi:hypothetical protein
MTPFITDYPEAPYEPLRRKLDDPHVIFERTRGRWTEPGRAAPTLAQEIAEARERKERESRAHPLTYHQAVALARSIGGSLAKIGLRPDNVTADDLHRQTTAYYRARAAAKRLGFPEPQRPAKLVGG